MTQIVVNATGTATTSNQELLAKAVTKRYSYSISNLSTTETVYVSRGVAAAIASSGVAIPPGGFFVESTVEGYPCWQGAVQIIASGSATIAYSEAKEDN